MPTPSKGIRARNLLIAQQMADDRRRGLAWGQIAMKYGYDKSNARKMVLRLREAA